MRQSWEETSKRTGDEGNANKRVCILQYSKEALFNDEKQALILFVTIGKPAMEKIHNDLPACPHCVQANHLMRN